MPKHLILKSKIGEPSVNVANGTDFSSFQLGNSEIVISLLNAKSKDFYWLLVNKCFNSKHSGPKHWNILLLTWMMKTGLVSLNLFDLSARKIKRISL